MNEAGILHIPDSRYCFALSNHELVIRLRMAKEDKKTRVYLLYGKKYNYHFERSKVEMPLKFEDKTFVYFEIKLKLEDTRLAYIFKLDNDNQQYYFSEDGLTKTYDFDNGFYNFFQMPYINEVDIFPTVDWIKESVFYQIFVDRFSQGDFDKNQDYIDMKWGEKPTPKNFAGGDLRGIINHLDYLSNLGITAIYLTPIFKSPSNHKYDIINYYLIDEHFGSLGDLKELVEKAHQKGMRVILDAVFNHCSMESKEFSDVMTKGVNSPYYDWFLINGDYPDPESVNYECFASCNYMPKWNTSNPKVQEFLINVGLYWIREANIDGWRLDVSDEVSHDFWRQFRKAIKAEKSDCVLIGENWHDAYPYLMGDQYDSIMNYAFTKACLDYFAFDNFNALDLSHQLNQILMRNKRQVNQMNLNLLDSHDTHRILTQVGKSKDKLLAAIALMFAFPGVPCLYYGTEIGLEGGYDPDSRRTFNWEEKSWDKEFLNHIKAIISMKKNECIQNGDVSISSKADLLIIKRKWKQNVLTFQVNLGTEKQAVILPEFTLLDKGLQGNGFLLPYGYVFYET